MPPKIRRAHTLGYLPEIPCNLCDKPFRPKGKFNKRCPNCERKLEKGKIGRITSVKKNPRKGQGRAVQEFLE